MGKAMRSRVARIAVILLLALISIGGHRSYWRNDKQAITAISLQLDPNDPERKMVGALIFQGAWELRSDNSDFGGISGVAIRPGNRFLALSDAGTLIGFTFDASSLMQNSFIATLPGAADANYRDRDSEGMAYDPASGRIWVSYELHHAIRRFPAALNRVDGIKRIEFGRDWRANGSVEAIVHLSDGRFVIFVETHRRGDGSNSAFLFSGDPVEPGSSVTPFGYRAPNGYRPTDAAMLPDGRLLVLNRRISFPDGFSAKLTIVDPADISKDVAIKPITIATLTPPLLVENMEALAVTEEDGQTIVWMLSDNNFNPFLRTLLMKFALRLHNKKPEAETAPGFETLTK
jgi:hypothetical protein